ncbi:MAG: protease complex subunit PrcB family protein [Elusimicrobia bacterium]|nr:protease complex subunit PrcB family protein [Elusimicrobiota bacterium]
MADDAGAPAPQMAEAQSASPERLKQRTIMSKGAASSRALSEQRRMAEPLPAQWQGDHSGVNEPATMVTRDQKEWDAFWENHGGVPPDDIPSIDFRYFDAVGVFSGQKNTSGYSVEITNVRTLSEKTVVTYRESMPLQSGFMAQVLTSPYHIQLIPKTGLPVKFNKK